MHVAFIAYKHWSIALQATDVPYSQSIDKLLNKTKSLLLTNASNHSQKKKFKHYIQFS